MNASESLPKASRPPRIFSQPDPLPTDNQRVGVIKGLSGTSKTPPHLFVPFTMKKKGDASPPSRRSLRLAEQARQEMLRQRKLAHGGHEVGDTPEDPLHIPSDEEKEVAPSPPLEAEVGSPLNPDYDSDYVEFLTEFLAEDSLGDTPPASQATLDTTFPFAPSSAFEVDPPSPPSHTPSMVSTDSPTASV
nr:uncharacterized protein LOC109166971 [Ipomoea trifida]